MKKLLSRKNRAQALVEYIIIIVLIALVVLGVLYKLGLLSSDALGKNASLLSSPEATKISETSTPSPPDNDQILEDMKSRIQSFYEAHDKWPRTWSPYNFTDVGLDPVDYTSPINGLYWSPHGSNIGIANRAGDNYQVYVKKLDGTMVHLVDGWSLWYDVPSGQCYYHKIAPGNEVDFSSIVVTSN